jgi:hypothetical protein
MNEDRKIKLLHKILAVSGFFCALLILPVAHFFLLDAHVSGTEVGQVEGVSTERPDATSTPSPSPLTCAEKTQKLADLDTWLTEQKKFELDRYNSRVVNFQATLPTLQGSEKDALQKVIDGEQATYQRRVQAASDAVDVQKEETASLPCIVE